MTIYSYSAILITLAALLSYFNLRFIRLPASIAIMAAASLLSLFLLIISKFGVPITHEQISMFIQRAHFSALVMNILLGLLLFAGSLTIDLTHLRKHKVEIITLTIISTIASAFLIAALIYVVLQLLGLKLEFIYCLLFGSLISPTDPIAVLAVFKKLGAAKDLETIVSAESLFNDGVGVVLFITVYKLVFTGEPSSFFHVVELFLQQSVGGVCYGLVIGWIAYKLLATISDNKVEILLTIAVVFGGYTLAQNLDISGPLAMVVAGIFIANYKKDLTIKNRAALNHFWELVEELLNAVLFLLLGFELLAIDFQWVVLVAALCAIPIALIARYITVALPMTILKPWRHTTPHAITILTWGGLRGGLAVALALAIPDKVIKYQLLTLTYAVVAFAILVQGTTINYFVKLANQ